MELSFAPDSAHARFTSVRAAVELTERSYGPAVLARDRLVAEGLWERLRAEIAAEHERSAKPVADGPDRHGLRRDHRTQASAASVQRIQSRIGYDHKERPMTSTQAEILSGEGTASAQLMRMIHGYRVSQIVATLAHLAVADQLADGPASSDELAQVVVADPDALPRLLRAAASIGLLEESERGRFALTPLGALLRSDASGSLRDAAIAIVGPGQYRPWERLHDVVRTGRSHTADALGSDLWDYYRQHPDEGSRFARTMSWVSNSGLEELLASYDTSRFRRIIDVGGGSGELLAGILAHNRRAEGVLFELAPVIEGARQAAHIGRLDGRVQLLAGDFLHEVPVGGDLYVLKQILLNWDDEHARRILRNCHRAAGPGSTLVVIEWLLPSTPEPSSVHLLDLNMLVMLGGRQRSAEAYKELLDSTGWRVDQVIRTAATAYPWSIIEATRR